MHKITFNVDKLIRQLSVKNNRDYDKSLVAEWSGISRTTITALTKNSSVRIDLSTLGKLLDFFASHDMPITVADLFTVATVPDLANTGQTSATLAPATVSATGKMGNTVSE